MQTERLSIDTGRTRRIVDLTSEVKKFAEGQGDGLVNISLPHATCGLALMELGSGSEEDLFSRIDAVLPREDVYAHRHGAVGHGADHLVPAFIGPTLTLPVVRGRLSLGTWQSIALIDTNTDNPQREVLLAFVRSG